MRASGSLSHAYFGSVLFAAPPRPARFCSVGCLTGLVFVMAKRLYVGNLSYSVTGVELKSIFSPYGTVISAEVVS